uniref:MAM domain-containing protein n=1 Tax=Plectus sambesii TaxID=2011161 RepID=A0A914WXW8_9BILA
MRLASVSKREIEMIALSLLTYFATGNYYGRAIGVVSMRRFPLHLVAYACLQAASVATTSLSSSRSRAVVGGLPSSRGDAAVGGVARGVSLDAACDLFGQYTAVGRLTSTFNSPPCEPRRYVAEILQRVEINSLPASAEAQVTDGGRVSCNFDPNEFCSWYNAPTLADDDLGFNRAKFNLPVDASRFRCTTGHELIPDGDFLLAGSPEGPNDVATAAIETRIPCQLGPARLLFDYWATSERPSLRACVISNASGSLNCQGPLDHLGPQIIVQVPQHFDPFVIRLEVADIERDDVIIIDSILYEGQLCELVTETTTATVVHSTKVQLEEEQPPKEKDDTRPPAELPNQCKAIECDFNDGDACLYNTEGLGGSDPWRIGQGRLGNRLTGVQRRNDNDPIGGYAYVGWTGRDVSNSIFVLDSPEFTLSEPSTLLFDLYQRSVGPVLKVCVDDFDNCPYQSPAVDTHKFWHLDQEVDLLEGLHKVYFVVTGVSANLYIAIDNIRLKPGANSGSSDICTINK